jgi:hypothetical protein
MMFAVIRPEIGLTNIYLPRNLIDNSFEFNWGKNSGTILQFLLKLALW